ncbi:hypothetical protein ACB094_05G218600 [Castanea mollissima]
MKQTCLYVVAASCQNHHNVEVLLPGNNLPLHLGSPDLSRELTKALFPSCIFVLDENSSSEFRGLFPASLSISDFLEGPFTSEFIFQSFLPLLSATFFRTLLHCQGVQKQNPTVQFHKLTAVAAFFFSHFLSSCLLGG